MAIIKVSELDLACRDVEAITDMIESVRQERGVTRWEREFLDSIEGQLEARGFLTPKQLETLQGIHSQRVG
jgi:hypothetical protein